MVGNLTEWIMEVYEDQASGVIFRVGRGGNWQSSTGTDCPASWRQPRIPNGLDDAWGLRVALYLK